MNRQRLTTLFSSAALAFTLLIFQNCAPHSLFAGKAGSSGSSSSSLGGGNGDPYQGRDPMAFFADCGMVAQFPQTPPIAQQIHVIPRRVGDAVEYSVTFSSNGVDRSFTIPPDSSAASNTGGSGGVGGGVALPNPGAIVATFKSDTTKAEWIDLEFQFDPGVTQPMEGHLTMQSSQGNVDSTVQCTAHLASLPPN